MTGRRIGAGKRLCMGGWALNYIAQPGLFWGDENRAATSYTKEVLTIMVAPTNADVHHPHRLNMPAVTARLIAAQLRAEAADAATGSHEFGRGMSHAAWIVEQLADVMGAL